MYLPVYRHPNTADLYQQAAEQGMIIENQISGVGAVKSDPEIGHRLILLGLTSAATALALRVIQPQASFTRTVTTSISLGLLALLVEQGYEHYRTKTKAQS